MQTSETFNRERVQANLSALMALKESTPDRAALEGYSGWGGLREAVYDRGTYRQLKQLLSDTDIVDIKETFKSAYYTPRHVVEFLYDRLSKRGISPQRILEPSAGHGVFIKEMPENWQGAQCIAIEKDHTSCRLLKALHPGIDVRHQGFEEFEDSEGFDLIVGNPPYGQTQVKDERHADLTRVSIHHYFVGKCMRLLKPDGLLAMVLPRYFLDASEKHVRHIIAREGGSLLEAYRLPDDLFSDAKVTVDVVILQKRAGDTGWVNTRTCREGIKRAYMNTYFFQNPPQILGKIEFISVYGRDELSCKRSEASKGLLSESVTALEKVTENMTVENVTEDNPLSVSSESRAQTTHSVSAPDDTNAQRLLESGPVEQTSVETSEIQRVDLQEWQARVEKQLQRIEERKTALVNEKAGLEREEKACQSLLFTLREQALQWQTLEKALRAIEEQETLPCLQAKRSIEH